MARFSACIYVMLMMLTVYGLARAHTPKPTPAPTPSPTPTSSPTPIPTPAPTTHVPSPQPYFGYWYYFFGDCAAGAYVAQWYYMYSCSVSSMYIYDGTNIKLCIYGDSSCLTSEECIKSYQVNTCAPLPATSFPNGAVNVSFCSATSCDFSQSIYPVDPIP